MATDHASPRTALVPLVWLSVRQVTQRTGMSMDVVYDALAAGHLRGSQPGKNGSWRVHIDDVDTWMRNGRAGAA